MSNAPTVQISLRNDTAADWATANPRLLTGEFGFETDTFKAKVGDGVLYWNSLPYIADAALLASIVELSSAAPSPIGSVASPGQSAEAARADHVHALPVDVAIQGKLSAASGSFAGNVTVAGSLVGGAHRHSASEIDGLTLPTKLSQLQNDVNFITASNVPAAPVASVNGKTGSVVLAASDVGALPSTTSIPSKTSQLVNDAAFVVAGNLPVAGIKAGANVSVSADAKNVWTISATAADGGGAVSSVNGQIGNVVIAVPSKTSQLTNDSGFLTSHAVASVNGKTGAVVLSIPSSTSGLVNDSGYVSLSEVYPSVSKADAGKVLTVSASGSPSWSQVTYPVTSVNGKTGAVQLAALELSGFPQLSGNAGKFLATNGLAMSWEAQVAPVSSVAGRTGAITLSLDDVGGFPARTGNASKFLATDGFAVSWQSAPSAPVLSVNGKTGAVSLGLQDVGLPAVSGAAGKVLTTDGTSVSWASPAVGVTSVNSRTGAVSLTVASMPDFPSQASNSGKYLATTGTALEWRTVSAGVASVAGRTGEVTLSTGDVAGFQEGVRSVVRGTLAQGANVFLTQNDSTGEVVISAKVDGQFVAGVSSINGQTGDVTISVPDAEDISAAVRSTIKAGDGISVTASDGDTVVIAATGTGGGWTGGPGYRPVAVAAQPVDATAVNGQATFSVAITGGSPPYEYQWQRAPAGTEQWASLASEPRASGASTTLLVLTQLTAADHNTIYRCVIRALVDAVITQQVLLETVTLKVSELETQQLELLADQAAPVNALVVRAMSASAIAYQWTRSTDYSPSTGDGAFVAIPGATSASYGSFAERLSAGNDIAVVWYKCFVTSEGATLQTVPCKITVRRSVLMLTQQPEDRLVTQADFSNPAYSPTTGPGGRRTIEVPVSFQYVKEGSAPRVTWLESESGKSWTGAVGRVKGSAPNQLWVDVTEGARSTMWYMAELRFSEPNGDGTYRTVTRQTEPCFVYLGGPEIVRQPRPTEASFGTAVFDVVAQGPDYDTAGELDVSTLTYQWYRIPAGSTAEELVSGATGLSLRLTGLSTPNNGDAYYCLVSYAGWSVRSEAATLTVRSDVNPPAAGLSPGEAIITKQPAGGVLREGDVGPFVQFETSLRTLSGQTVSFSWEYYDEATSAWIALSSHPSKGVLFNQTNLATSRLNFNTISEAHHKLRLRGKVSRGGLSWYTNSAQFEVSSSMRIVSEAGNFLGNTQAACVEIKNFGGVIFAIMHSGPTANPAAVPSTGYDYVSSARRWLVRSLDNGKTWTTVNTATGWWTTMCLHRGRLYLIAPSAGRLAYDVYNYSSWRPITSTRIFSLAEQNLTKPSISLGDWKDERPKFTLYHSAGAASDGNLLVMGHNLGVVSGTSISTARERAAPIPQEVGVTSYKVHLQWKLPHPELTWNPVFVLHSPATGKWIVAGGVYATGGNLSRAGCGCSDHISQPDATCIERDCRQVEVDFGGGVDLVFVDEHLNRSVGNSSAWSSDGITWSPLPEMFLGKHFKQQLAHNVKGQLYTGIWEQRTAAHDWDAHVAHYVPGKMLRDGVGRFMVGFVYPSLDDRMGDGQDRKLGGAANLQAGATARAYSGHTILTCRETDNPGLAASWQRHVLRLNSTIENLEYAPPKNSTAFAPYSGSVITTSLALHSDGFLYAAGPVVARAAGAPSCATKSQEARSTIGIYRVRVDDWISGDGSFTALGILPTFICGDYTRRNGAANNGPFFPAVPKNANVALITDRTSPPSGGNPGAIALTTVNGKFWKRLGHPYYRWIEYAGPHESSLGRYASNVVVASDGVVLAIANQSHGGYGAGLSMPASFVAGIRAAQPAAGRPAWTPYLDPELLNQ
jgi:hypothetical protein